MCYDQSYMKQALALAKQASTENEVPVGAIVVAQDEVIGRGYNRSIQDCDPTAHAEIVALREAAKTLQNYRLADGELYVTIEPCAMCVGAMLHARIRRVVFGATEPRAGALTSKMKMMDMPHFNHTFDWQGGVLEQACGDLIKDFFRERR